MIDYGVSHEELVKQVNTILPAGIGLKEEAIRPLPKGPKTDIVP